MPYILNLTTGSALTTVNDGTVDNSTSLTFLGKNFSGYGQPFEENFVKLLENFSSPGTSNMPSLPILSRSLQGQLWFNSTNNQLYVNYDGENFKGIGSITVGSTSTVSNPSEGDMFWDNGVLYGYHQGIPINIGPANGSQFSSWLYGRTLSSNSFSYPSIVGLVGTLPVVTFSYNTYPPQNSTLINNYKQLTQDREKITQLMNEYQTLEEQQIQGDIKINQNYYSFLLLIALAIIILFMVYNLSGSTPSIQSGGNLSSNAYYYVFGIILVVFCIIYYYTN
jgi:hypothetical protein